MKGDRKARRKMPPMWAWVLDPDRMWFHKCDRCQRRKLVANFYEVYGKCGTCPTCKRKGRKPGTGIWWWECTSCLLATLTERLEEWRKNQVTGYVWHPDGRVDLFYDTDEEEPVEQCLCPDTDEA